MKRGVDLIVSSSVLILFFPLYFIIAVAVWMDLGWPILDKQRYPGMNEQWFTIYRFRTMNRCCDEFGKLLPANQRLSPLGRFLKKIKLDHLPEFYNVFRGEMSLVGPRPGFIRSIPTRDTKLIRPCRLSWDDRLESTTR